MTRIYRGLLYLEVGCSGLCIYENCPLEIGCGVERRLCWSGRTLTPFSLDREPGYALVANLLFLNRQSRLWYKPTPDQEGSIDRRADICQ